MKRKLLYGLVTSVSMFSIAAYADPAPDASSSALTTKGYVDTGLKYVYDAIKGDVTDVQGDITNIQNALSDGNGGLVDVSALKDDIGTAGAGNTPGTGLIGDVEALQDTVGAPASGNNPATGLIGDVAALSDDVDDLADDVDDLKTAVGDANSGLIKKVNELEAASQEYIEGTGIDISQNAQGKNVVSLDLGTTQNNTTYVFKTDANGVGTWQAMEVEDSWNPGFLTTTTNP